MPDRAEQRDREIARNGHRPMASPFSTKVVGVSFIPGYPHNLLDLRDAMEEARMLTGHEPFPAILRRNPDNEHDSNAIEVHAPVLGNRGLLGHLTRPIAQRLAPELDRGVRWAGEIEAVLIEPSAPTQPGVSIRCRRLEEGEGLYDDGLVRPQVEERQLRSGMFRVRRLADRPRRDEGVPWEVAPEPAQSPRDIEEDRLLDALLREEERVVPDWASVPRTSIHYTTTTTYWDDSQARRLVDAVMADTYDASVARDGTITYSSNTSWTF